MPKNSAMSGSKNKGKGNNLGLALAKNIRGIPMHLQAKNPAAYLVSKTAPRRQGTPLISHHAHTILNQTKPNTPR